MSRDTIFALSSGRPPAGVAVVRISGHKALETLNNITDNVPIERRATLACLRALDGTVLDHALVLAFPAPNSFTGEDVAELHLHGGSAVVAAVLDDLAKRSGHRLAESGEFSRRAFDNGKFDLTQAEGLADLIAAESEAQRRQALAQGGGRLRERAENWRCRILALQAAAEADLDFSDEGDVVAAAPGADLPALIGELADSLDDGHLGERLREGFAIAVIGEPNVGKSSLINALSGRDAAIVTDIPGTTRDIIEVPLTLAGLPILLVDTAGLRDSDDPIEAEGIRRARARARDADLVLQVYDAAASPPQPIAGAMQIANKLDTVPAIGQASRPTGPISVSARDGTNIGPLKQTLSEWAGTMGAKAEAALITQRRHRDAIADAVDALRAAVSLSDPVLHAEHLRLAARAIGRLTGRAGVEDMLDALFGAFCIGK